MTMTVAKYVLVCNDVVKKPVPVLTGEYVEIEFFFSLKSIINKNGSYWTAQFNILGYYGC